MVTKRRGRPDESGGLYVVPAAAGLSHQGPVLVSGLRTGERWIVGDGNAAFRLLHRIQSQSVDWATRWGGYSVLPLPGPFLDCRMCGGRVLDGEVGKVGQQLCPECSRAVLAVFQRPAADGSGGDGG